MAKKPKAVAPPVNIAEETVPAGTFRRTIKKYAKSLIQLKGSKAQKLADGTQFGVLDEAAILSVHLGSSWVKP